MKYILSLVIGMSLLACNRSESNDEIITTNAYIEFEESNFDFGTITEGEQVSHAFGFTNSGTDPLEIISVNVSCGCTVASKPMGLIPAGGSDQIVINFNSMGKQGMNNKSVGVFTNAKNNRETLTFTAQVEAAE